jgi:hypothetical protein
MTKSHNRQEYRKWCCPFSTALAVIAMSEAKKQSRISPYFTLYFSGLLRLAPRNNGYAERT